jgi:hypothetical protein
VAVEMSRPLVAKQSRMPLPAQAPEMSASIGNMKLLMSAWALMFFGLASMSGAADLFVGTWKLNVAKSKLLPGDESAPWPKEFTRTFEEQGAALLVTERQVSSTGRIQSKSMRFSSTGGLGTPIEDTLPAGQSVVLKRIADNTIIIELDQEGHAFRTSRMTVSADGRTMTVEEKGGSVNPQRQDKKIDRVEVFDRQ